MKNAAVLFILSVCYIASTEQAAALAGVRHTYPSRSWKEMEHKIQQGLGMKNFKMKMKRSHSSRTSTACLREEIKQRKAAASEAFAKKDIDSFVGFFAPDATLMFPDSDYIQGEPAIKQRYQKFFDSGAAYIRMEILEVGPMGGDSNTAYDRGYVQILNAQHDVMIDGKYLAIWKKIGGKWLVYIDSYNSKG